MKQLRADPMQQELVRACYYDDPLLEAAERFYRSSEWRDTQKLLGERAGSVLELGAGRGIASYAFARDGWRAIAVEPDSSAIVGASAIAALARSSGCRIDVVRGAGERIPFASGSFDVVYCRAVMHHASNLTALCREAARVLRPGGRLIAVREHVISRPRDLQVFLRNHPLHRHYGGEHAYLLRDYLTALRNAGLQVSHVLNPLASEINIYPSSLENVQRSIARRLGLPTAVVPKRLIPLLGRILRTPGRLYTFVGRRRTSAP